MDILKKGISLVINAKNEEANIRECIGSAREIADEIVVVDMASSDRTGEIAKQLGARVYSVKDYGFVEPARDFAISKAGYDWVLLLDADERIRRPLARKIKDIVSENRYDVVEIPRKNIIFGKWIRHAHWWPDHVAKLFKKDYVSWPKGIHAAPVCKGKVLTMPAEERYAISHNNYKSISEFVERTNRYTSHEGELLRKKKFRQDELFNYYEKEFTYRFFREKGYLDGLHGFFLSRLMEYYKFLELAKHWERLGYKNIIASTNLKSAVEKHLANSAQVAEIKRLNREVKRLNKISDTLKEIQSAKTYKVWQFYCSLRDRLLK